MAGRSRPGAVEETDEDCAGARNQGEASTDARDPLSEQGRGGDRAADPAWARRGSGLGALRIRIVGACRRIANATTSPCGMGSGDPPV